MKRITIQCFLFIPVLTLLMSCSDKDNINPNEAASYFFTDDFETGDLSKTENGFEWSSTDYKTVETPNGTLGLKFKYGPDNLNEDSWQERRFSLGKDYSEFWLKYDLYLPEN